MKSVAWSMITIGIFIGVWQLGARLSTDAIGMGVGLVFGVLAGVPAALMIMLAGGTNRMGESADDAYYRGYQAGQQDLRGLMFNEPPPRGRLPAPTITVKPMHVHPSQAPRRLEGGQR